VAKDNDVTKTTRINLFSNLPLWLTVVSGGHFELYFN
jgi:hypothetical protein